MQFPEQIMKLISDETYQTDDIGMSDSSVLVFHDKVLKIQKHTKESDNEYYMMLWLKDKLQIPTVYAYEIQGGKSYLLMSKCNGEMACQQKYMENPQKQVRLLAKGLKNLWNVNITTCSIQWNLKHKLEMARYNIKNGLIDIDNVEPSTFGENGFKNPTALLQWLYDNQPNEEFVLSHGDYCLPNVFFMNNDVSGYIDLGKTGIADKWCDIALCYRSLSYNYTGRYHGKTYSGFDDLLLFKELGIQPDWEKIKYYILLDELF